jgi:single-stranded-DNA-specific exonuclease
VGSGRSVPGYDLYNAIKQCDTLLEQWGGHQAAAGLTLSLDKIEEFRDKFEETVSQSIPEDLLTPLQEYDLEIGLEDITPAFCKSIERFGPFGPENMKPVFASRQVICYGRPRIVGNNHLQLSVSDRDGRNVQRCIGFGMGEYLDKLNRVAFDICYTVEPNEYRDIYQVSLNLKDIHLD